MKTHKSTQLFLYCSGGERSVKCVRTALEMEASKEEQRDVVCFMVAEGAAMLHKVKMPRNAVAHPHTANLVRDKLQRFDWETLQHPPYSSDLSPCDFHVFDDLKKDIRGYRFQSDEEVQEWMRLWIHQCPNSFYKTGIDCLVSQWDRCINTSGNYF